MHSGRLFLVTAPSGAGKISLYTLFSKMIMRSTCPFHTTRQPRPGELNGREYHFVSVEEFETRKERGEFLEWALVHGNYYGTSRVWIEEQMAAGRDVLLEIDWQGAQQILIQFADTVGNIYPPPPLWKRSKNAYINGEPTREETIARRLKGAGAEIEHAPEFEFVIINGDFDRAPLSFSSS